MSLGGRAADRLAATVGSWGFVIGQAAFLAVWFVMNIASWCFHWDAYPFILANLAMSAEAAFTGPIILMSSNRAAAQDRKTFNEDLLEDQRTNKMVKAIADQLGVSSD